jgi:hypothetical protein
MKIRKGFSLEIWIQSGEMDFRYVDMDFCNFCRLDMGITSKDRKESEAAQVNVKGAHEGTLQ